ncbi:hypothetical protein CEP48_05430 [Mergibacter septicus]|uniref:Autotransporter domain-containing protein n=1 Tax=Mergibacter septicus TaxID=221402 RepID=A0A8D4LK88_9PAST|nr:autotransporter domain-containing protein [Mergibacter septicus]AWX15650.1 hypothetical protein CEP47_05430 [Mergibacter septicus]QDJ14904.1 hypothetical protein CEP48_05430 [Mergibacter septicus]UTU47670.1 autotransporter domain-containing protein [Mergibacter septicus]WMR96725.1 autotransporter domain-containing protein [Mergibacter septicus]
MKRFTYSKLSFTLFSALLASSLFAAEEPAPAPTTVQPSSTIPIVTDEIRDQALDLYKAKMKAVNEVDASLGLKERLIKKIETSKDVAVRTKILNYNRLDSIFKETAKEVSADLAKRHGLTEKEAISRGLFALLTDPNKDDPLLSKFSNRITKEALVNIAKETKDPETIKLSNEFEKITDKAKQDVDIARDKSRDLQLLLKDKAKNISEDDVLAIINNLIDTSAFNKDAEKAVQYKFNVTGLELFKNLQNSLLNTTQKTFDYTRQQGTGVWAVLDHERLAHTDKKKHFTTANNKGNLTTASFGYQKTLNGVRFGVLANVGQGETKAGQDLSFKHTLAQGGAYIGASNQNVFIEGGIIAGVDSVKATSHLTAIETKAKFNAKTLGVILNGGYKFILNDKLSVTPVISYQYQELSGVKTKLSALEVRTQRLAVNQAGVSVDVNYKPLPDLSILAKVGVDGIKRNSQVDKPQFTVLPLSETTIHQTKDKDVRTHFSLEASKQFGKATIGGAVGYNHYLKSKLSGVNVGLNLGYRF